MNSTTSTSEASENAYLFVFIPSRVSFGVWIYVQYFFVAVRNQTSNKKYLLKLIRRKSKIHEKNISGESSLSFDQ